MDLTHAYIPMGDGTYEILHNREKKDTHVMDLRGPNYVSEHYHDMPPQFIEYDPSELPFIQEDSIEMFLPWTDEKKIAKYHRKELGSIHIVQEEDEKHEEIVKYTIQTETPHDKNTPCINFNEGSPMLMWNKRKGKPKYDQKDNNSWLGPYITKKKSDKEMYYLTTLDGRKMPLPVDGSLLQPHI
jgi:hypothetical protein